MGGERAGGGFRQGGASTHPKRGASRRGDTTFPDYSLDPVCWDPLSLQASSRLQNVLKAPSLRPPLLSPDSLSPCGEADELAAQGADGDAGATTSAAWGQWRAGQQRSCRGRVSSAWRLRRD